MYCNNCGNKINNGATFCTMCGTKMGETEKKPTNQKCCICGNKLDDKREVLLIGKKGDQKDICATCGMHVASLENNSNIMKVDEAVTYFSYYRNYMDREVKECISSILKEKQISNNLGSSGTFSWGSGTSWVSGMRAVAWLMFWGIIIAGVALGISTGEEIGFIIFLISIPVAFLSVAWTMIFLDLADDIRTIKNEMLDKK